MTDAISRADAIKIVQNRCKRHTTACVLAVTEIKQLPPIQPAEPQIIRCKDCKYAEYIDDVKTLWCTECGQGRTVAPNDFCSYAERREVTT